MVDGIRICIYLLYLLYFKAVPAGLRLVFGL